MADPPGFENAGRTPLALTTRAPKAWSNLLRVVTLTGPQSLVKADRARARLRRIR